MKKMLKPTQQIKAMHSYIPAIKKSWM